MSERDVCFCLLRGRIPGSGEEYAAVALRDYLAHGTAYLLFRIAGREVLRINVDQLAMARNVPWLGEHWVSTERHRLHYDYRVVEQRLELRITIDRNVGSDYGGEGNEMAYMGVIRYCYESGEWSVQRYLGTDLPAESPTVFPALAAPQ